jgi:hypothetical protein
VHDGRVLTLGPVSAGELAVFAEGPAPIAFRAQNDASFVLGSAVRHPHDLVLGDYSVHTDAAALARGEEGIRRIGADLRRAGKV